MYINILLFVLFSHIYLRIVYQRWHLKMCIYVFIILNMLTFALTTFTCWFQKEEIKSCEERVKKLLEMTPPKGKDFLCKIDHILEREKNWVRDFSVHPCFSLSLSLSRNSLEIVMFAVYLNLFQISLILGVVEAWWLPTIWKATIGEENSTRWS